MSVSPPSTAKKGFQAAGYLDRDTLVNAENMPAMYPSYLQ